jgi:putative integral membrane protein (TIGR02587 family)
MNIRNKLNKSIWLREIKDLIRGICGGFLFGIPLLYTMEIWWIGSFTTPQTMLVTIAITFAVVYMLNQTEGFRQKRRNTRPQEIITDTIEAIAIGLVCSTLVLVLLRELNVETPLKEAIGKIVFESVPFTLGVAVANLLLGDSRNAQSSQSDSSHSKASGSLAEEEEALGWEDSGLPSQSFLKTSKTFRKRQGEQLNDTLRDIGGGFIGAIFIAFNIAPTDEIPMLAAAVSPPWLLLIILVSLLVSYGIVFEAGFSQQQRRMQQRGIFQHPLSETIAAYLLSLIASVALLVFFQQLNSADPWKVWLEYTILLGFPATIGGAAGRLAV